MGHWGWECCLGEDRGKKDQEEFVGKGFPILSEEGKTRYGGISTRTVMEPSETEFSYFLNICVSYSIATVKVNLLKDMCKFTALGRQLRKSSH